MFYLLLLVMLIAAAAVSHLVIKYFQAPLQTILGKVVDEAVCAAWFVYLRFAVYVVGISGGVGLYQLERSLSGGALDLGLETWVLELVRTVLGALQAIAWMLLAVYITALVASVVLRLFESRAATEKAE